MKDNNGLEAQRWRDQARHDQAVAQHDAKGGFHSDACFCAQRAAEKALKAYGYARGERDLRGHSLSELRRRWRDLDAEFDAIDRPCCVLDRYYMAPRYPDAVPAGLPADLYDDKDSTEAINFAETIISMVERKTMANNDS